jgi:hypothetical protein
MVGAVTSVGIAPFGPSPRPAAAAPVDDKEAAQIRDLVDQEIQKAGGTNVDVDIKPLPNGVYAVILAGFTGREKGEGGRNITAKTISDAAEKALSDLQIPHRIYLEGLHEGPPDQAEKPASERVRLFYLRDASAIATVVNNITAASDELKTLKAGSIDTNMIILYGSNAVNHKRAIKRNQSGDPRS